MKRVLKGIIKGLNVFFTSVAVIIIVLAVYNFISAKIFNNKYTNFFGYTFFEVVSGSMSPYIEKSDFIFIDVTDNDYKEKDVVTFESDDGSFITHRIIKITDTAVITKGDANNTIDNPITKDKIIGKVVKIIPNLGVWIDVITTPKVVLAILMTIILITLCVSCFSTEEKKGLKNKKKKENIMLKSDNTGRLIFELGILFVLLISLAVLIPFTLSRFKTEARSDVEVEIAFYLVNDKYQYENIKLEDIIPRAEDYTYDFSVSNTDGVNRTETALTYDVEIITTTNLPLTYDLLLRDDNGNYSSIVTSDVVDLDEDSSYFRTINTATRDFGFDVDETNYYRLVVNFPLEYKDSIYQGISENIEIRIHSRQLLPGDN